MNPGFRPTLTDGLALSENNAENASVRQGGGQIFILDNVSNPNAAV